MSKQNENNLLPAPWRYAFWVLVGILAGGLAFIFQISKAPSYLSDDPRTCVNCHIMAPQYATWNHSSHRQWASCNDCHVPHNNKVNSYYFKAMDGLRHASVFTMRNEPQVIRIKEKGIGVVQDNCIRCHGVMFSDRHQPPLMGPHHKMGGDRLCWDCHREVPHGRVYSLSSVPYARVPVPASPVPDWIRNLSK